MAEQNLNSDGIWDGTPGSLEAGAGADEDGGLDGAPSDQGVAEMLRREVAWMRVWKAEWEKTSEI